MATFSIRYEEATVGLNYFNPSISSLVTVVPGVDYDVEEEQKDGEEQSSTGKRARCWNREVFIHTHFWGCSRHNRTYWKIKVIWDLKQSRVCLTTLDVFWTTTTIVFHLQLLESVLHFITIFHPDSCSGQFLLAEIDLLILMINPSKIFRSFWLRDSPQILLKERNSSI